MVHPVSAMELLDTSWIVLSNVDITLECVKQTSPAQN